MIAVIFEVEPNAGAREAYLDIAQRLKPTLMAMDGFVSIERFQSLSDPQRLLSLSFWRDEASIRQWRNVEAHRSAQSAGRSGIFAGYRLRIAHVVRDYGMNDRAQAPDDSRRMHDARNRLESADRRHAQRIPDAVHDHERPEVAVNSRIRHRPSAAAGS